MVVVVLMQLELAVIMHVVVVEVVVMEVVVV